MSSKEYHKEYTRLRYHLKKNEFISLLGGTCISCGSVENLEFDHKDSESKSFEIGRLLNYSKEKLCVEVQKCQLLCSDCHKEKTKVNKDGYSLRAKGERVNTAKLTESSVKEIRLRLNSFTDTQLAKEFNVSRKAISFIRGGVTWKHVTA